MSCGRRGLWIVVTLITILLALPIAAIDLDGSFSSQLYWYEDAQFVHIRPYESLRLNWHAWQDQERELSFHTSARYTTDLNDRFATDPQLFIRSAYLKFRCRPNRFQINLGRQFVYSSAGSALIDGVRLKFNKYRPLELNLFAGTSVSRLDPEKVRSFSDYLVIGGRAAYKLGRSFRPGINWMIEKKEGSLSYHRLSLDSRYNYQRWQMYGRLGYSPLNQSLSELLARLSWSRTKWYLSAEWLQRDPSVSDNSIFSLIQFDQYQLIRIQARRTLTPGLAVFAHQQYSIYSDDNSYEISAGLQKNDLSIGLRHQSGYAGDYNSLFGSARVSGSSEWAAYSSFNLGRYQVQEYQENTIDSYSANLGLERKYPSGLTLSAEIQFLRNGLKSDDWRTFLQLTKNFQMKD
ncbi:MAG: hypothetical protein P1R58_04855 [bacterium]|nr:hypothetical protein [bacterium]